MVGKDPHWYDVQVSDTTMLLIASLLIQQKLLKKLTVKLKF